MSMDWYFSEVLHLFFMAFPLLRPPSPSKRRAVSSIVCPVVATPSTPAESGGIGSAKEKSASGLSMVPKLTRSRKFVLKHSSK